MQRIWLVLLGGLLSANLYAASAYKWVDAEGNVQYSQQPPPPGVKAEEMKLPAAPPPAAADANAQPAPAAENAEAPKPAPAKEETDASALSPEELKKQNCEKSQVYLKSLSVPGEIAVPDENNKLKKLSDAERKAAVQKAEALVAKYCSEGGGEEKPEDGAK
jgi:hypothetical protein